VLHFRYPYVSVQLDSYSKFSTGQFLVGRGESDAAEVIKMGWRVLFG